MPEASEPSERARSPWPELLECQLKDVGPGTHICSIYSAPADRARVLGAFFGGGLKHGQQCLYFADPGRAQEVLRSWQVGGAPRHGACGRGALSAVTTRQQFVWNGHFEPQAMLELLDALANRARANGFAGVRIACEMGWVLGPDIGSERLHEYEALLNSTGATSGRSIVCQYDRHRTQPQVVLDVLRAHPVAILGEWVHDNLSYASVERVLDKMNVQRAPADWMMGQLHAHARRGVALFDLGRLLQQGASAVDLMRAAPALIAAELQLDSVEVFELVAQGDAVRVMGSSGVDQTGLNTVEHLDPDSFLAEVTLGLGQPLVVPDWQHETRLKLSGTLRDADIRSSVAIAIGGGSAPIYGALSAHSRTPRFFSDDVLLFVETIGQLLASAYAAASGAGTQRAFVQDTPDVIVRFSGDLHVIAANPAIERTTGIAAESLIGKTSADLFIAEPLVPSWELLLRHVWRTGCEQSFELMVRARTGERIFDTRVVLERGGDGTAQSLLTIARDVTDQRRVETERAELYRQLVAQQDWVEEILSRLAQRHVHALGRTDAAAQFDHLSNRERTILQLIAAGRTNREIGAELGLTPGTIKNHVARILSKLGVTDRTQAAVRAFALGLVDWADVDGTEGSAGSATASSAQR